MINQLLVRHCAQLWHLVLQLDEHVSAQLIRVPHAGVLVG